ncbi:antiviral reverse transcriptase Drt3b [Neorhizobium galegae]|uniref:Phage abortive infection protein n=1 Tax=Neorhizobium galegae bv. officinalis TaxID=323656 RepID=A0A0T7GAB9_NEOGA|nr:antiviral reverse transcriptase Drt3b [Neorhizobium galegae]CDZ44263.1 Phage abortive infection protein [Neorhizobium galegae bv. officinalis]
MSEIDVRLRELRAILTETLPYELPLGFTNDNLFLSELKASAMPETQRKALEKLRSPKAEYTKPFLYKINRTYRSKNTIAIIHPIIQLRIAKFYADFENTIIQSCSRSTFSIRYPASILRIHVKGTSSDVRKRWSLGLPKQEFGERIKTPYSPSYFAYNKYILLDRFFNSNELVRLESRFGYLRTLDVSRCFFNIYTHSISWAHKEKDFSKQNSNKYSFEQQFDEIMQKSNYNETAGIVVGPEVSRIFAEIILQRIDLDLERRALERGLSSEKDYAIRRYVDDFHIFTNNIDHLNILEDLLADGLEEYKLFLNADKRDDLKRPFVTGISRVKHEVRKVCEALSQALSDKIDFSTDAHAASSSSFLKRGRACLDELRYLGGSERGKFVNSFSDVFTTLHDIVRKLQREFPEDESRDLFIAELMGRMRLVIRILFYLLSVDFRVPPLIRASFLLQDIVKLALKLPRSEQKSTHAYIAYELSEILSTNYEVEKGPLSLEITNTFLLGLMIDPVAFCSQDSIRRLVHQVLTGAHAGYFAILCGLHYQISVGSNEMEHTVQSSEDASRKKFCDEVAAYIASDVCNPNVNSEDYLIFCDFLSCPAPDHTLRWNTFNQKLGGQGISKADFDEVALKMRHTNWKTKGREFELLVKRLQPVYFSA